MPPAAGGNSGATASTPPAAGRKSDDATASTPPAASKESAAAGTPPAAVKTTSGEQGRLGDVKPEQEVGDKDRKKTHAEFLEQRKKEMGEVVLRMAPGGYAVMDEDGNVEYNYIDNDDDYGYHNFW